MKNTKKLPFKAIQLIALLISLTAPLYSQAQLQTEMTPEAIEYYAHEFSQVLNQVQLQEQTALQIAGVPLANKCEIFMKKEDHLGPLGESVYQLLAQKNSDFEKVLEGGNITRYCPKYAEMAQDQKAFVWTLIMTTMAHFESSCKISASIKGPNGMTYGYYQLHKGQESRYVRNKRHCSNNSSQDGKLSSACALSMINDQLNRTGGNLFSRDSYWDVLRPQGHAQKADDIQRALSRFSLCNPKRG
jgi:hypothetical protein